MRLIINGSTLLLIAGLFVVLYLIGRSFSI